VRNGSGSAATRSAHPIVSQSKLAVSPEGMSVPLPYSTSIYISSGGIYQYYQFRLNSPNDFDYTGTGQQPTSYDQWASFFSLYKVYKTEFQVTIIPTTKALALVFYYQPNTTGATTFDAAASQRNSTSVVCGVYETKTIRRTIMMADAFGADYSEFGSSLYGASVGTNPSAIMYGTVDIFNIDGSATVSCYITIKAKLFCQFTSPVYLAISLSDKTEESKPRLESSSQPDHSKEILDLKSGLQKLITDFQKL
jgi:hypothetical protein